ncbi:hypothetical protein ACN2XU_10735 [Primorskyibacter sp. 2E107]|uniref:hypothetical protein n=1 Tax=Primorskyibacter sp. 2E107 TaxID=3403458 RepID=UPI003AF6867A
MTIRSIAAALSLLGTPALAHTGVHVVPHGTNWTAILAAVAVIAVAGFVAFGASRR